MEDKEPGKLLKITLEYENVIKETVSERNAEEWLDLINGMCIFMDNRNMNPFKIYNHEQKWRVTNK